jgi:hypothetical protein
LSTGTISPRSVAIAKLIFISLTSLYFLSSNIALNSGNFSRARTKDLMIKSIKDKSTSFSKS